tara:strand:- start:2149 stop:2358 length:210 start_codon:yes stop_codon:yes gene_type:complete
MIYKTPLAIVITHWFFVTGTVAIVILLFLTGNNGSAPEAGVSAPGVTSEARTVIRNAKGAVSEAPQARR